MLTHDVNSSVWVQAQYTLITTIRYHSNRTCTRNRSLIASIQILSKCSNDFLRTQSSRLQTACDASCILTQSVLIIMNGQPRRSENAVINLHHILIVFLIWGYSLRRRNTSWSTERKYLRCWKGWLLSFGKLNNKMRGTWISFPAYLRYIGLI